MIYWFSIVENSFDLSREFGIIAILDLTINVIDEMFSIEISIRSDQFL